MIFTYAQIEEYTRRFLEEAPPYTDGLLFRQSAPTLDDLGVDALLMWLRRLCESEEGLSVYFVVSTHKSNSRLKRAILHTKGKAGKPKKIVRGDRAVPHIHGLVISTVGNVPRDKIANYLRKRRKKRPCLRQADMKSAWGTLPVVSYMRAQADSEHIIGDFDFMYYCSPFCLQPT